MAGVSIFSPALSYVEGQCAIWLLPTDYSDMSLFFCAAECSGTEIELLTNNL
jgi:hypothetical protein